nr:FtsX-like permease family protein [uncultured Allomuricauda sp.]
MKLGYLAFKNMVSKPLNLLLSLLLLTLSVALVTFVLQLSGQLGGQLNKNIAPFDMVVGAKGSPLQLVLSSVLHVDVPTGNIKLKEIATLQNHPFVEEAIPVSYGDNYKGYRILGTKPDYLDSYEASLGDGRLYQKSFEVVVGSSARSKLNLQLGDTFISSHGLVESAGEGHEDHPFEVVGILEPTGTVVDQLLISNLESVWEAHDHEGEGHEEHDQEGEHGHGEHEDHDGHDHHGEHENHQEDETREITSLLIKFKSPLGMVQLPRFINENTTMQAALPGFEINRLMGLLGAGASTINGIALAILLVSGLSIFISLLKTIRERRQELALLRTYGLRPQELLGLALMEGLFLACIGFVLGWTLGRIGVWGASQYMQAAYGYVLQVRGPEPTELYFMAIILALAFVASILASLSIFKLNVAKTLSDV